MTSAIQKNLLSQVFQYKDTTFKSYPKTVTIDKYEIGKDVFAQKMPKVLDRALENPQKSPAWVANVVSILRRYPGDKIFDTCMVANGFTVNCLTIA